MSKPLATYLEAQIELGESEIFFDEFLDFVYPPPGQTSTTAPETKAPPQQPLPHQGTASFTPSSAPGSQPVPYLKNRTAAPSPAPEAPAVSFAAPPPPQTNFDWKALESAATLTEFYQILSRHPLYPSGNIIPNFGAHPDAMVVVSLAPDNQCDQYLPAAQQELLTNMFKAVHIDYALSPCTYLIKNSLTRKPMPRELKQHRRILLKELALLQPQMVILLGEDTLQGIFERSHTLQDHGGQVLKLTHLGQELAFIPLITPLAMLQNPKLKAITWKQHFPRSGYFKMP